MTKPRIKTRPTKAESRLLSRQLDYAAMIKSREEYYLGYKKPGSLKKCQ